MIDIPRSSAWSRTACLREPILRRAAKRPSGADTCSAARSPRLASAAPARLADALESARAARAREAASIALTAGAQAGALASAAVAALHAAATRLAGAYRAFPLQPKVYFLSSAVVVSIWVSAERAQLAFIDSHRDEIERKRLAELVHR